MNILMSRSKVLIAAICMSLFQPVSGVDLFPTYQEALFYHFNSRPQWELAFQALQNFPLKGNETILHIGSRSGRVSAYLANRLPQGKVIGVDSYASMIEFSRANYGPALYPNLRFIQNETLENYFTNVIDLAVSFSILHSFLDQKVFLAKVHQALKPGGKILFLIPAHYTQEIKDVFSDHSAKEEWKEFYANYSHPRKKYTPDEYRSFLQETGFKEIDVCVISFQYAFETKRELIDWWSAFSAILPTLPPEKRPMFCNDFAHCFLRHFPYQADGRIPYVENHLLIRAVK